MRERDFTQFIFVTFIIPELCSCCVRIYLHCCAAVLHWLTSKIDGPKKMRREKKSQKRNALVLVAKSDVPFTVNILSHRTEVNVCNVAIIINDGAHIEEFSGATQKKSHTEIEHMAHIQFCGFKMAFEYYGMPCVQAKQSTQTERPIMDERCTYTWHTMYNRLYKIFHCLGFNTIVRVSYLIYIFRLPLPLLMLPHCPPSITIYHDQHHLCLHPIFCIAVAADVAATCQCRRLFASLFLLFCKSVCSIRTSV